MAARARTSGSRSGCPNRRCRSTGLPRADDGGNLFLKIRNFACSRTQITCISFAVPAHTKGRFAIVTDVGQGMRWTRVARLTRAHPCGRRSRVVLTPRRWRQVSQKCLRGDGGKQARSPGRARNKLLKPSRAGMPGDLGATVVTNACAYYTSRTRLRVHRAPGIPHALCWARDSCTTRADHAAGMRWRILPSSRANGSRECAPDDRLREAIHSFFAATWIASSLRSSQ
jgi:hypothetical protein